jgi:hypothetical protein
MPWMNYCATVAHLWIPLTVQTLKNWCIVLYHLLYSHEPYRSPNIYSMYVKYSFRTIQIECGVIRLKYMHTVTAVSKKLEGWWQEHNHHQWLHSPSGPRPPVTRFLDHILRRTVGLPGRVISPSRGLYLHRTTQHRETKDRHPCPERDSKQRSTVRELKAHASDRAVTGSTWQELTWWNFSGNRLRDQTKRTWFLLLHITLHCDVHILAASSNLSRHAPVHPRNWSVGTYIPHVTALIWFVCYKLQLGITWDIFKLQLTSINNLPVLPWID